MLIPQGLLEDLPTRTDEGLFSPKDLLTVLSPSLEHLSESEPILRPLFRAESRQILSFCNKNAQITAESWGFLRLVLLELCQVCGSGD